MLGIGIVEDMRDVNPVEYIRAVGLRPEDSYGFLPLQLLSGSSYFFLYRDRPEYEQARAALPESQTFVNFDFFMGSGEPSDNEISPDSWLGRRITGLTDQAAELAKSYEGTYGAPPQPEPVDLSGPNPVASDEQIASIEKLRAMGVLDDDAYRQMISLAKGGEAGPLPGGVEAARCTRTRRRSSSIASIPGCTCARQRASSTTSCRPTGGRSACAPRTCTASSRVGPTPRTEARGTRAWPSGTTSDRLPRSCGVRPGARGLA